MVSSSVFKYVTHGLCAQEPGYIHAWSVSGEKNKEFFYKKGGSFHLTLTVFLVELKKIFFTVLGE